MAVSYFSPYPQEFDDGKLGEVSNKAELFHTLINMQKLLDYVSEVFEFTIESDNPARTQYSITILKQELHQRSSLLAQHCEEVILELQPNTEMGEDNMKELMSDPDLMKKNKSFKEAMTKYMADKKFMGAVAMFLKYLHNKEVFMSYAIEKVPDFYEKEMYNMTES